MCFLAVCSPIDIDYPCFMILYLYKESVLPLEPHPHQESYLDGIIK